MNFKYLYVAVRIPNNLNLTSHMKLSGNDLLDLLVVQKRPRWPHNGVKSTPLADLKYFTLEDLLCFVCLISLVCLSGC